jgi:hypothetical protein
MTMREGSRPALRLVQGAETLLSKVESSWFCGHCAAPSPGGDAPDPSARVCTSCGLGLLLETREDAVPSDRDAFLVVDGALLVQAMSRRAQVLLCMTEDEAVNRPVAELLVPADAESQVAGGFASTVVNAAAGALELGSAFVRPWNTFGVRMRARIAHCGPPRAALVVLDGPPGRRLRAV